jgi:hypothetical protein
MAGKVSNSGYRLRAAVFCEDGVAGDYTFELARVGAIDYRDERIIHVAESGVEWEIGVETGQRVRGGRTEPSVSSPLPSRKKRCSWSGPTTVSLSFETVEA